MQAMESYQSERIKYYIVTKKETGLNGSTLSKNMVELSSGRKIDVDLKCLEDCIPIDRNNKELCWYSNNEKIQKFIEQLATDDFTNVDGVCFIFLTFLSKEMKEGEETILIGPGLGKPVTINELLDTVKRKKELVGKPKIFLIQADDMSLLPKKETKAKCDAQEEPRVLMEGPDMKKIPTDADRLVIKCSIPQKWAEILPDDEKKISVGARPHSDDENENSLGPRTSFFIRAFCDKLNENENKLDLLSLTPNINNRVKEMIKKCNRTPDTQKLKYPTSSSTLTKAFKLPLKVPSSTEVV